MKIEIKGLEELDRKFREAERKVERVSGSREVPIGEILTPDFMARFTNFASVDDMLDKSGFEVNTAEDFQTVTDDDAWSDFVAVNTQFPTWGNMLVAAYEEHIQARLDL